MRVELCENTVGADSKTLPAVRICWLSIYQDENSQHWLWSACTDWPEQMGPVNSVMKCLCNEYTVYDV